MTTTCRFLELLLLVLTLTTVAEAQIRVGTAVVDITPPVGGLTTGYSSAEPTDGIHDPVTARILVLEAEGRRAVLATCDLCIYNSDWLYDQMPALDVDQLLLLNTHTHAGPKMSQDDFPSPDSPWRKTVDQRILDGIKQAKASSFVGYFAASDTQVQLGYNRLIRRGPYSVTYFDNPQRIPYGTVDPLVGVIRITDDEGRVRVVIVNHAVHPVVLGPRNRKISADYPGVTRAIIEDQYGDDCTCIFVQGAAGDINPLFLARDDDREKDFELVTAMGESLATEVKRALSLIRDETGRSESFEFQSFEREFDRRFEPDETLRLGATTLVINREIGIATMPGEPFHRFQTSWREQAELPHAYLFGYCSNGSYPWPSYLPDVMSAARGGYGASDTTVAQVGVGESLLNQALVQLFTIQGRLKDTAQRHTWPEDVDPDAVD